MAIERKDLTTPNASAKGVRADQLRAGMRVEKEHTSKPEIARQIALDHLRELPDYYTRLERMEHGAHKEAAAHKLQGRRTFRGLEISIENKKGSRRYWYDPHGKEKGSTLMHADYGYIRGTEGTDGDHVDVYVGDQEDAPEVYIVNQVKKPEGSVKNDGKEWSGFDEQKCMLGFGSAKEAKELYLKQYDDPRFFGSMHTMPFDEFAQKVLDKSFHGKKIANGDMLQYYLDHPEKKRERAERKSKEAQMSKADSRRAALVAEQRMVGRGPTLLGSYPTKEASLDPEIVEQRAKHIDDAGLALLATPAAVNLAHLGLESAGKHAPGVLGRGAASLAAKLAPAAHFLEHNPLARHGVELAGLAAVSPTVSEAIAKKIPSRFAPSPELAADAKVSGAQDLLKDPSKLVNALSARRVAQGAAPISSGGAALISRQLQRPGTNVRDVVRAHASAVPLKGITKMSDMRSQALNASANMLLDGLTSAGKRIPNLAARGATRGAIGRAATQVQHAPVPAATGIHLPQGFRPGQVAQKELAAPVRIAPASKVPAAAKGPSPLDQAVGRSVDAAKSVPSMQAPAATGPYMADLPRGGNANWAPAQAARTPQGPGSAVLGTHKPGQQPPSAIVPHAHPSAPAGGAVSPGVAPGAAQGGPPTIVPPGASQELAAGAPVRRRSAITPGRVLGGAALGVGGLGLYGGYRTIDTVANMMDPAYAHNASAGPDPVYGPGRVY